MQLGLWIGLCFAASFALRRRIRLLVAAVLVLWFLVPAVGSSVITGVASGPLSLHAASWLILAMFAVQLLEDPRALGRVVARHFVLFLILTLVVLVAFLASLTSEEGGMVLLADQIVAPVLFFLILLAAADTEPDLLLLLRRLLLGLVAVACLVALVQWLSHDVLFYEEGYLTQYWFSPETSRWMGTLDQPLALSLAISVTAPLVAGLRRYTLQIGLLVLMTIGVLITQSRVGLFALAISVIAVVLFDKRRAWLKVTLLAVFAAAAAAMVASPLFSGVAARLADDTGSTQARANAMEYFLTHWSEYAVAGQGIGASYRVAVQGGLQTSFENALAMYGIDFGIVFAFLYFACMAFLVFRNAPRQHYRGLTLAGLFALVVPQTYSSLATRSAAAIIVWTVLAMIVMAGDAAVRGHRQPPERRLDPAGTHATAEAHAKAAQPPQ